MTNYLVMIYYNEAQWAAAGSEAARANSLRHEAFAQANGAAIRGGARLGSSETATAIRPDGQGGFAITDGTFAETKEVLGGFYLIEAQDLDEALAIARQVPAPTGGIEVRPLM